MYDHYIALDWAKNNMALARMTKKSKKIKVTESPSDLSDIKEYLKSLKGEKIFTLEETSSSQWLYSELKPFVKKLIVCDPYRNRLLSEGAKNDKIDAMKLVYLLKANMLKANMLKEIYHSGEDFIYLRKLVSGYEDVVKSGVRLKNQRSALFRSEGLEYKKDSFSSKNKSGYFVLNEKNNQIEINEEIKKKYEKEFEKLSKRYKEIRLLKSLPGIGNIHAIQIIASVVNIRRFKRKGNFLSYCGLIKHEKMSGGRSSGKRRTRYYRPLKQIFKLASYAVTHEVCHNPLREFYEYLLKEKQISPEMARHKVARRLAVLVYGVLKTGEKFSPYRRRGDIREKR